MENTPPPGPGSGPGAAAAELRQIEVALLRLDAERARLLWRRGQLLASLRPPPVPPVRPVRPVTWPAPEASPPDVRNLLLALGGVLLAVAATAFTLVSWGHLGMGGRATVLGALTLAALGVPVLLLRRSLTATAEAVACLGLVLLLLDAYSVRRVALSGTAGWEYAAVSIALVSAVWAGYGLGLRPCGLVLPLPTALLLAQLPLTLWALGARSAYGLAAALLTTAAFDAVPAVSVRRLRATGAVAGAVTGSGGLVLAVWLSVTADGAGAAARAGALLLAGALAALVTTAVVVRRVGDGGAGQASLALAAAAGGAVVAGSGGVVRTFAGDGWDVPGYLLCAVALLGVVVALSVRGSVLPRPLLGGLAVSAAAVQGLAGLWALPALVVAVLGPLGWLGSVWSGAPHGAREATAPQLGAVGPPSVVAVAAVLGAVLMVVAKAPAAWPLSPAQATRRAAGGAAVILGAVAAAALPAALALPYTVAVLLRLALVAVLLAAATRIALACGTVLAGTAVAWGLAEPSMTLVALGVLLAAFAGVAVLSRQVVGAPAAVVCAAGLAWAGPVAADRPAHEAAFVVLGVAAGAALLAARAGGRALEYAGYAAAALAVALSAEDAPALALVLALSGVLAGGVALRRERRPAGYAGTALLVAASWVRLAASDVTVPEAYALPVSAAALALGLLRRRHDPAISSWAAYGPGLTAILLPSLLAAWGDPLWLRPLLLGAGALALTLLGARRRLRAPLVLGASALALDALHELAPLVVQLMGALPRWLPLALAGALLLTLGATYERRLRDVRRVRDTLGRMR